MLVVQQVSELIFDLSNQMTYFMILCSVTRRRKKKFCNNFHKFYRWNLIRVKFCERTRNKRNSHGNGVNDVNWIKRISHKEIRLYEITAFQTTFVSTVNDFSGWVSCVFFSDRTNKILRPHSWTKPTIFFSYSFFLFTLSFDVVQVHCYLQKKKKKHEEIFDIWTRYFFLSFHNLFGSSENEKQMMWYAMFLIALFLCIVNEWPYMDSNAKALHTHRSQFSRVI